MSDSFQELSKYKFLIRSLVKKMIRGRYSSTRLGILWNALTPLITILLFYIVFDNIIGKGVPHYWQYICVGIFPFTMMVNSLTIGTTAISSNPEYVSKVQFPKIIMPLSTTILFFICFIIEYALAIVIFIISGFNIKWIALLQIFPASFVMFIFSFGIICLFCTINVYVRDFEHLINVLSRLIFWFSPVVYLPELVGEPLASLLYLNPLTPYIKLFQDALYFSDFSSVWIWSYAICLAIFIFIIGVFLFKKYEGGFAERV